MVNADKPHLWKQDVALSVDMYNLWFMQFAPKAYRNTRAKTVDDVKEAFAATSDLARIESDVVKVMPRILPTLRMATAPPIARDRLMGLARTTSHLVGALESGKIPPRLAADTLDLHLEQICMILRNMLDRDIFLWLDGQRSPLPDERERAATIVADRLCGAVSDPIVRNAQESRQLALIEQFLVGRNYVRMPHPTSLPLTEMKPGTFAFRMNVAVGKIKRVNIPIDVVIQPNDRHAPAMPLLIEAKSAGDFTNTNKRRKEEAMKIHQLRDTYGSDTRLILFLCGYFDSGYLGYEAAEGLDWVWEHRISDLAQFGI